MTHAKQAMKNELLTSARAGINDFLYSLRGAAMFGAGARTKIVNGPPMIIEISCNLPCTSGLTFFEVRITEKIG